jgi:hypothetical protein
MPKQIMLLLAGWPVALLLVVYITISKANTYL